MEDSLDMHCNFEHYDFTIHRIFKTHFKEILTKRCKKLNFWLKNWVKKTIPSNLAPKKKEN